MYQINERTVSGKHANSFIADRYEKTARFVCGGISTEYHQWAGIAMAWSGVRVASNVSICVNSSSFAIFPELSQNEI